MKSLSDKVFKITINLSLIIIIIMTNLVVYGPISNAASYNQVIIEANANNNNGISAFPTSYQNA